MGCAAHPMARGLHAGMLEGPSNFMKELPHKRLRGSVALFRLPHKVGDCQNYGPFLGSLN